MDISHTLEPASDQLDAVELIGGPRTFTIASVSKGTPEQPVEIHLDGFPRPWRPGKSMRRVLAAAWGTDASVYAGRRVTLYCDPAVRFGTDVVGGTRISHLSHIPKRLSVPLLVSRGKSATFTVDPLPDQAPEAHPEPMATTEQLTRLMAAVAARGIDKAHILGWCSQELGDVPLASGADLTYGQAALLIDRAEADQ